MTGNDKNFLNSFNSNKINYGSHPGFVSAVKDLYDVDEVRVHALTLSYKGLIKKCSFKSLSSEGLLGKRDLPFLASKAMVGSLAAFHFYYKSTS